jgi:DNA-directed RNA polymerase specialized sigma24 family protein
MIDKDDIDQEYRIQKWLHDGWDVRHIVFDILRSKAYNFAWGDRFIHFSLEAIMERPDAGEIFPDEDRWSDIDQYIDLKDIFSEVQSSDRNILMMIMQGYSHGDIAKIKGLSRSAISKRINKIYKTIRKKRRSYYAVS